MPIVYALNMFGLSFATLSSLLVWVILEKRDVLASAARSVPSLLTRSWKRDASEKDTTDVPMWWYLIACVLALFMTIFAVEWWETELRWYGVLLAWAVALVFFGPVSFPAPGRPHTNKSSSP